MRFTAVPILIVLLATSACHDHELTTPYNGVLSRREAEVAAFFLREWPGNLKIGPGHITPDMFPLAGEMALRCPLGGDFRLVYNQDRAWNDSTKRSATDLRVQINLDECVHPAYRGVPGLTLSAQNSLNSASHSQYVGANQDGVFSDHLRGSFTWELPDHRRGKCVIDYVYTWHLDAKRETRSGNVCGHKFDETNDWGETGLDDANRW